MIRVVYEVLHWVRKYFCTAKFIFSMKIVSLKAPVSRENNNSMKTWYIQASAGCIYYFSVFCDKSFHYGVSGLQIHICNLNLKRTHKLYLAGYTLTAKYVKTIAKCEKRKVYSGVFRVTFFAFCISQHFTPGSAFVQKVKGFRGLFFRGINKIRNSHEIRKVYSQPYSTPQKFLISREKFHFCVLKIFRIALRKFFVSPEKYLFWELRVLRIRQSISQILPPPLGRWLSR